MSGLTGTQGRTALDLMNKAREDEEAGNRGSAIKEYEKVASKYQGSVYAPEALYRAGRLLDACASSTTSAFQDFQGCCGATRTRSGSTT